jgi:DNA-binding CsgD family transcriptional regulator
VSGFADPRVARSQHLGPSSWTVRSQLDAVFAKTGTRRQPDLVRVLLLAEKL